MFPALSRPSAKEFCTASPELPCRITASVNWKLTGSARSAGSRPSWPTCLRPCHPGVFWNVNLPSLRPDEPEPRVVFCPLETGPLPLAFRTESDLYHYDGNYHQRRRQPGSDVDICFGGNIAVTRIALF